MKKQNAFELISTDDKIGSFQIIGKLLDSALLKMLLFAANLLLYWLMHGCPTDLIGHIIPGAFFSLIFSLGEVALVAVAGVAEIPAEIIADCIAPRPEGLGTTTHPTSAPPKQKKERIKLTGRTIRNLIGGWTMRLNPTSIEDYFCAGISVTVGSYTNGQLVRGITPYEAEVRMLWFIQMYLVLVERSDLLGKGKRFVRRATRLMFKDYPDEMKPFLNSDMSISFSSFKHDIMKLQEQRRSSNHTRQSVYECCVDLFNGYYNRKGDPETAALLENSIAAALDHANSI